MERNEFNAAAIPDYRGTLTGSVALPPAEDTEVPADPGPGKNSGEKKSIWQFEITKKRVPRADLMNFSRQRASFIRAGIPILEASDSSAAKTGNKTFKEALIDIGASLRQGETFSAAVAAHEKTFPSFYVDMLRAAELTGRLDSVLDQLSRYIERDLEAKRKIRAAMTYPALIGAMSLVTVGILSVFVLPRFKTFFAGFNAKLPLPTRMVLTAGGFVGQWWWAIAAVVVTVVLVLLALFKSAAGRAGLDRI